MTTTIQSTPTTPWHRPLVQALSSARRAIIGWTITLAVVTAAMLAAVATPAAARSLATCANGESNDFYTDICLPDIAPNSPHDASPQSVPGNPSLDEVHGVPCTGSNSGTCIGLSRNDARKPDVQSQSTLNGQPIG